MTEAPMTLFHTRRLDRCGVTTTSLVLVLLLVLAAACTSLWMLQRSVSSFHQGALEVRRADQLARSAIAEAMHMVQVRANEPRPAPEEPAVAILDGFFRGFRPPVSTDRPPKLVARHIAAATSASPRRADRGGNRRGPRIDISAHATVREDRRSTTAIPAAMVYGFVARG